MPLCLQSLRLFLRGLQKRKLRAVTLGQLLAAAEKIVCLSPLPPPHLKQLLRKMKRALGLCPILLLLCSVVCWLGPGWQPSWRLLSLSVALNSVEVDWTLAGQPEEDFQRWMSNGGISEDVTDFRGRLALRILAFAVDVLPESIRNEYTADLAEVRGIDPLASRPLTWTEQLIKDELASQLQHGENLTAQDYKYFQFAPLTEAQTWDVDNLGIRIFTFQENAVATMRSVLETALLFTPLHTKGVAPLAAKRNVDFLTKYLGTEMKQPVDMKRTSRDDPVLNESDIHSGDFFGVLRLDGLDPMLAFGMGSQTGHTTVALWEET
eukprot:Skav222948  [mRNA]  locus=scaffold1489:633176:637151:+ [translate_table: standard]